MLHFPFMIHNLFCSVSEIETNKYTMGLKIPTTLSSSFKKTCMCATLHPHTKIHKEKNVQYQGGNGPYQRCGYFET